MTTSPLDMSLPTKMMLLSFASKAAEMMEQPAALSNIVNQQQLEALANEVRPILKSLDARPENEGFLPLPHDGIRWSER